jgi:sugar phosphate isomerase/epimerase
MRLAASALGWGRTDDPLMLSRLAEAGVGAIEVAPSKQWGPDWASLPVSAFREFRRKLADHGLAVASVQSLLYGVPGTIFQPDPSALADRLRRCHALAQELAAPVLVFGAMASRRRGDLPETEALSRAADFFSPLVAEGLPLLLEPIPAAYGCDFLTRTDQAVHLAESCGLGVHLDAGTCTMAGEDAACIARRYGGRARSVQVSGPGLGPVDGTDVEGFCTGLAEAGYAGWVSFERLAPDDGDAWQGLAASLTRLKTALKTVLKRAAG